MSGRQSDKSEKDLTEYDMPNSQKRKRGHLRGSNTERVGSFIGSFTETGLREYMLETGKDRTRQRIIMSQKIRTN